MEKASATVLRWLFLGHGRVNRPATVLVPGNLEPSSHIVLNTKWQFSAGYL
jgi:hypothetical protein